MKKTNAYVQTPSRVFTIFTILCVAIIGCAFFYFLPNVKMHQLPQQEISAFASIDNSKNTTSVIELENISDFTPMFLPTKWNNRADIKFDTGESEMETPREEEYAKELITYQSNDDPEKIARSGLFRSTMRNMFSGFRRTNIDVAILNNQTKISVVDMRSGKIVFSSNFEINLSEKMLSPAEFIINISDVGITSVPLKIKSSGNDDLDDQLMKFCLSNRILKKSNKPLPQGSYKIICTQ